VNNQPLRPHREDVPGLTGLRFVAALCVLAGHGLSTLSAHETPFGWIYWVKQLSGFGMTLFFVLSGFVIHYNYARLVRDKGLHGIAAYLWARFARLYPLFLLMLLVYIVVSSRFRDLLGGHPERFESTLQALPYFLTSTHSWLYIPIQGNALISAIGGGSPVTWSISTEWFFYFLYPCIAWLLLKPQKSWAAAVVLVLWCAVWIVLAVNLYDQTQVIDTWAVGRFGAVASIDSNQQDSFVRWLLYISPYLRMGEFVLGALAAQFYVVMRKHRVTAAENVTGAVILLAAVLSVPYIMHEMYDTSVDSNVFRKMNMNFALGPSAAVVIFCAARYTGPLAFLNSRPLVALGEASYSIYLVHQVVLATVVRLWPEAHSLTFDLARLAAQIIVILAISLALYASYENWTRRWLRQQWAKPRVAFSLAAGGPVLALVIACASPWL
jgi:peptidoglycan/LPS O-acetylase OafA/YrhL